MHWQDQLWFKLAMIVHGEAYAFPLFDVTSQILFFMLRVVPPPTTMIEDGNGFAIGNFWDKSCYAQRGQNKRSFGLCILVFYFIKDKNSIQALASYSDAMVLGCAFRYIFGGGIRPQYDDTMLLRRFCVFVFYYAARTGGHVSHSNFWNKSCQCPPQDCVVT